MSSFNRQCRSFVAFLALAATTLLTSSCTELSPHRGRDPDSSDSSASTRTTRHRLVFVGTYTDGPAEGIYLLRLDSHTGELTHTGQVTPAPDPAFLAIHPGGRFLYSVNEMLSRKLDPTVSAYSIAPGSGKLTFLNRLAAGGTLPCHLAVDSSGKNVLVSNYGGANVAVLRVAEDGRLSERSALKQHKGSSVHARQEGPHPHCVTLDPANRFAFVADLGLDRVVTYAFDAESGTLRPGAVPFATTEPGAGPRHLSFGPNGRFAYLINELTSTITVFLYDPEAGDLEAKQTVAALPVGYRGRSTTAEIEIHPSGRFLYGSNRGHDSIVVFAIDEETGTLTYVEHEKTQGKTPRNFGIDPTGRFLLAANENSDTIVVFRIDSKTGELHPTGHVAQVPRPVCVKFFPQSA